ncbi:MAG TPA: tRNA uridine-5-carboxymethylaminomethyl(34) synthesis GTPase MnmE [Hyphomicrobiaceae bacterium]|nr:tRNA uridine-5-carboxymethylaminomethyl(34) synthesis GTPase MnmE [Hyphomicrobiaceae bacterium]
MSQPQTIFALSSGHGRAGVAVIRISGPAASEAIERMAAPLPKPRFAAFRKIKHPGTGEVLDEALVLWFPAPKSETGEDMAEFQVHGGRAVIQGVLAGLGSIEGCRLAEPGEFTRRALENGKLDLTGVEGLADLVEAETSAQRRQALRQAGGALFRLYEGWRKRLIGAMSQMEAAIDFSDEPDVAVVPVKAARAEVEALASEIGRHLDDGHRGELLREGFHVVLAGPPNAGKSSLLNALARRDVAIVSEEAGTTRDVIEVRLELEGLPVVVSDTAGVRPATGQVEQEGIRRTLGRAREADLILWLIDVTAPPAAVPAEIAAKADRTLVIANKMDLLASGVLHPLPGGAIGISVLTGDGMDNLARRLTAFVRARIGESEAPVLTQERHRQQLERCMAPLKSFLGSPIGEVELRAEDLRRAAHALGRLTGAVDVEDVLDEVFSRFCIGK